MDPDWDEACVAEYRPIGLAEEHPDFAPPAEPDRPDDGDPDPHLRVRLTTPEPFDARAARPKVVLTFHLSDTALKQDRSHALIRSDHANQIDPATLTELTDWLTGTGCHIVVKPIIDPANTAPADTYEIPNRIRTAVRYRNIADTSPWGSSTNINLDLDHTTAYRKNGPPGQTRVGNLAPLLRPVHRAKTVGAKQIRQPEPGIYLWRSRHAHLTLVTNRGTINLGRSPFTETLWHLARTYQPSIVETKIIDLCYSRTPISA